MKHLYEPVSYTHLDVYKRQAQLCECLTQTAACLFRRTSRPQQIAKAFARQHSAGVQGENGQPRRGLAARKRDRLVGAGYGKAAEQAEVECGSADHHRRSATGKAQNAGASARVLSGRDARQWCCASVDKHMDMLPRYNGRHCATPPSRKIRSSAKKTLPIRQ